MTIRLQPCWSRTEIQIATQVDVGGLTIDDPASKAVFLAVHHSAPVAQAVRSHGELSIVTEMDVLADVTQAVDSNEPLLRFITGEAGTGKSHLVRWLYTRLPAEPRWHVVYIEKRNTSLRRVIEQILAGIHTPNAEQLRAELARTGGRLRDIEDAKLALVQQMERLVRSGEAVAIAGTDQHAVDALRPSLARLLGDYSFRTVLLRPDGAIDRVARIAMSGLGSEDESVDEHDLTISADELKIDTYDLEDASTEVILLVRGQLTNARVRAAMSQILNAYLPRATAAVFTGPTTDLLKVFEDVRAELAKHDKELFLFVEDLVVLHAIDEDLAQALTIPARPGLARTRAIIAVTRGYLENYRTFLDRGVQYTMDIPRERLAPAELTRFVARYLNAGRVGRDRLAVTGDSPQVPNACDACPFGDAHRKQCLETFGASAVEGYGLYPFNQAAIQNLIKLASPKTFDPRQVLRWVIRDSLEVAESEIGQPGTYPSPRFARGLDPTRSELTPEIKHALDQRGQFPAAETSLRAFYAAHPPIADSELELVAEALGVSLTDIRAESYELDTATSVDSTVVPTTPARSPVDAWLDGKQQLPRDAATKIRSWVFGLVSSQLEYGDHGLHILASASRVQIGSMPLAHNNIWIDNASGGGGAKPEMILPFEQTTADAVILKGILAAARSGRLDTTADPDWYFALQHKVSRFISDVISRARTQSSEKVSAAVAVLGLLSHATSSRPHTGPEALAALLQPLPPIRNAPPAIANWLQDSVVPARQAALTVVRDHLTRRRGSGAPCVLDASSIVRTVMTATRHAMLPASLISGGGGPGLETLAKRQGTAAQAAWTVINRPLEKIRVLLAGADLASTTKAIDDFVQDAHELSFLPYNDARATHQRNRSRITDADIQRCQRLLNVAPKDAGPESIWELIDDPSPALEAVLVYLTYSNDLLTVRQSPQEPTGERAAYDRRRLQKDLRDLADKLEGPR